MYSGTGILLVLENAARCLFAFLTWYRSLEPPKSPGLFHSL
jgi:hypothetical protein